LSAIIHHIEGMFRKRFLAAIGVIFMLCAATSATSQHYALRQYTAVDGLPQSQVNAMVEDRYGYLWMGTSGGGLARFDGREFKVYSTFDGLLSNIITTLFIDSRGSIWIVHPQGITRFNGLDFKRFQSSASGDRLKRIRKLVEFQDTIFMFSNPGMIGRIYNDSVHFWSRPILPGKSIFFTHVSASGIPCFYLNDSSFVIPSNAGYRTFSHARVFNTAYNMYNRADEIWIESDKGTFALDLTTGTFSPRTKMISRYIICYDEPTATYWTRDERTLFRERVVGNHVELDTVLQDIPIIQVLLDREGNAWFGSAGNGLYRFYAKDFNKLSHRTRRIMAVHEDAAKNLWIGGAQLVLVRGGKEKAFPLPNGNDDAVRTIRSSPSGTVWVGSYSGLGRYVESEGRFNWFTREHGLSSAYVTALEFDGANRMWIGTTGGGLNVFDGKAFHPFVTSQPGLKNIASLCYLPSMNTLFIGTEFGLHAMKDEKLVSIPLPEFENTTILSLAPFRDSLLLAGSGGAGVAIIDPRRATHTFIGPREGLPSGFVFFVSVDDEERVWIGTEKGITRVMLNDNLEISQTRDFGFNNGLTGIETNQNAYFLSPQKKYFGLIDGLYEYHESEKATRHSYPVHLTGIEIQFGETPVLPYGRPAAGFFNLPASLVLPADKNHVTFYFNRVDKWYPNAVRYKYFLKSFDKSWSLPSAMGRVTYSNLPTGSYEFQVISTNKEGSWDELPISYPFTIEAPFYQTATFYLLLGGMAFGLVVLFIFARMRRNVSRAIQVEHIRQQEQEFLRKEIARDFHDDMGNQLTRIINYVSLMRLNGQGPGQDLYRKVEESAKYLYNGTRDFIWAIDPVNDDLAKLFLHIRDFGEKLFEEKGIHFRAFNEITEKVRLPYGFSREANLIFKETMTNAFKHSGATNVSFYMRLVDGGYRMVLEDDGVGLDIEQVQVSNGIKNIKARAEKINASLQFDTPTDGRGTRVQLIFTLTKKQNYDTAFQKTDPHRRR